VLIVDSLIGFSSV